MLFPSFIITVVITSIIYAIFNTKIIVIPDIEGNVDVLLSILKANGIKNYKLPLFTTLIILGDATDRGNFNIKVLEIMISLYENNLGRVVLILGNRDINKLRLITLLPQYKSKYSFTAGNKIIEWNPTKYSTKVEFAEWIFMHTMGAPNLLQLLANELLMTKQEALKEYMYHVKKGLVYKYWKYGKIAHIQDDTIFIHGGIPQNWEEKNIQQEVNQLDIWLTSLKKLWDVQLTQPHQKLWDVQLTQPQKKIWDGCIKYKDDQECLAGIFSMGMTGAPNSPIVGNVNNLSEKLIQTLAESKIYNVVVGHNPKGDLAQIIHHKVEYVKKNSIFTFVNTFSGDIYVTTIELDTCRGIDVITSIAYDRWGGTPTIAYDRWGGTPTISKNVITYLVMNLWGNYVKGNSSIGMKICMNVNLLQLGTTTIYGTLRYRDWFKSIYCKVDGYKYTNTVVN